MAVPAVLGGLGKAFTGAGLATKGLATKGLGAARRFGTTAATTKLFGGRGGDRAKGQTPLVGNKARIRPQMPGFGGVGGGSVGAIVPFRGSKARSEESINSNLQGSNTVLGQLAGIRNTLQKILGVERQEEDRVQESIEDFARDRERSKRDAEQQRQETKKGKTSGVLSTAGSAVSSLFGGFNPFGALMDLLKFGILDWVGKKENREAVMGMVNTFKEVFKFLQFFWKHLGAPIAGMVWTTFSSGVRIMGAFLTVIKDIFTGKIFTNPGEFFKNLINIPLTILDTIPDLIGALVNLLTFGLVDNVDEIIRGIVSSIGSFVSNLFTNKGPSPIDKDTPSHAEAGLPGLKDNVDDAKNDAYSQNLNQGVLGPDVDTTNMTEKEIFELRRKKVNEAQEKVNNKDKNNKDTSVINGKTTVTNSKTKPEPVRSNRGSRNRFKNRSVSKSKPLVTNVNQTSASSITTKQDTKSVLLNQVQNESFMLDQSEKGSRGSNIVSVSDREQAAATEIATAPSLGNNLPSHGRVGTVLLNNL